MANSTDPERINRKKEGKIKLPFEQKSSDWGSWVYEHRAGICVTVIAYLLFGIVFVSARIAVNQNEATQGFYVDMEQLIQEKEELEEKVKEMEMLQQMNREYYENVRNATSNADGKLDAGLKDDRGTQASEIYDEANALEGKLNAARESYERGVREANEILQSKNRAQQGNNDKREDARVKGRVTVSYSLPGRHATRLPVPAYMCEGGGEVVVAITVNQNGKVIAANVAQGSSNDPCLTETATKAALDSRFNVDGTAPNRQQGTITYLFIPQ